MASSRRLLGDLVACVINFMSFLIDPIVSVPDGTNYG